MKIKGLRRRHTNTPSREHGAVALTRTPTRAITPRMRDHVTRLVVEVGNRAGAWREAANEAALAYRRWTCAPSGGRGDAAAAYLAAIEREEQAASEYSRALEVCSTTSPYAARPTL
jgi:hypothetical protein